jgi:hypothetical protein
VVDEVDAAVQCKDVSVDFSSLLSPLAFPQDVIVAVVNNIIIICIVLI